MAKGRERAIKQCITQIDSAVDSVLANEAEAHEERCKEKHEEGVEWALRMLHARLQQLKQTEEQAPHTKLQPSKRARRTT